MAAFVALFKGKRGLAKFGEHKFGAAGGGVCAAAGTLIKNLFMAVMLTLSLEGVRNRYSLSENPKISSGIPIIFSDVRTLLSPNLRKA
jgi:hypothetical protein